MKRTLPIILAFVLISSAVAHAIVPELFAPIIPAFIPMLLANYLAGSIELVLGVLLLIPKYKSIGGLGFMLLMIGFLPLHIWELFRENPAVGPYPLPILRLLFQFVLIYSGYWIYTSHSSDKKPA
jgi:uncharacterized membrane protein